METTNMGSGHRTEQQLKLLCESRNRLIRETLISANERLHIEELADHLVAQDVFVVSSSTYQSKLNQAILDLHHDTLPRLSEAELVEYDRGTKLVGASAFTPSEVKWHEGDQLQQLLAQFNASSVDNSGNIGIVKGFDSVLRHGRKLADEAEQEFFTIYATTDLLEDECLGYGERLLARGVSLHIGSQNPEVRELSRVHLPDATVWEPQLDWLNTPSYPRVGRLILADREKVIFSILTEPPSEDNAPEEIGLVGEGADSPLVVLVRELLGTRLDHLDYQSDDFHTKITQQYD